MRARFAESSKPWRCPLPFVSMGCIDSVAHSGLWSHPSAMADPIHDALGGGGAHPMGGHDCICALSPAVGPVLSGSGEPPEICQDVLVTVSVKRIPVLKNWLHLRNVSGNRHWMIMEL